MFTTAGFTAATRSANPGSLVVPGTEIGDWPAVWLAEMAAAVPPARSVVASSAAAILWRPIIRFKLYVMAVRCPKFRCAAAGATATCKGNLGADDLCRNATPDEK
jgi:hypothetical protein